MIVSKAATSCSANLTPRPFTSTIKGLYFYLPSCHLLHIPPPLPSSLPNAHPQPSTVRHFFQPSTPVSHADDGTEPTYFFGLRRGVTLIISYSNPIYRLVAFSRLMTMMLLYRSVAVRYANNFF